MLQRVVFAALWVGLWATSAAATPAAERDGRHSYDGLYISPGINVGGGLDLGGAQDGLVVGGEVSLVALEGSLWYGAYLDLLYMSNRVVGRTSLGGEIGVGFIGIEAGYVSEFGGSETFHGVRLGGVLTLAAVSVYARGVILPDRDAHNTLEVGFLFKLPIQLD